MPAVIEGKGPAIRRAYQDLGLSREKFAELVELEPKTITNITAPQGGVVSREGAVRIAKVLGWKVGEVIPDEADPGQATDAETEAATDSSASSSATAETSRGAA